MQINGSLIAALFVFLIPINLYSRQNDLLGKVKYNDIDAVKSLIEAGEEVNQQEEGTGYTALMWACEFNYPEMIKLLVEKDADVNLRAKDGTTALIRAAGNAPDAVELLLSKGADIKAVPEDGIGVLFQAGFGVLYKGFPTEIVQILLDHGAEVNATVKSPEEIAGFTPLIFAARENHKALVKLLIDNGADVNARAKDGKTAMALAMDEDYSEIADLLKANGAK